MTQVLAPWTEEQAAKLNEWQACDWVHPFTCINDPETNAAHRDFVKAVGRDGPILVATEEGWFCPICGYRQGWAHDFMFNGAPPRPFAEETK